MHPACLLLVLTLLLTSAATLLLTYAELTDNWEIIRFDQDSVQRTVKESNGTHRLEWILDDQVGMVTINKDYPENRTVFLVPMNGGIWTLCVSLTESQRKELRAVGFSHPMCTNYLSPELLSRAELRNDWIHQPQHIVCAGQSHPAGGLGSGRSVRRAAETKLGSAHHRLHVPDGSDFLHLQLFNYSFQAQNEAGLWRAGLSDHPRVLPQPHVPARLVTADGLDRSHHLSDGQPVLDPAGPLHALHSRLFPAQLLKGDTHG